MRNAFSASSLKIIESLCFTKTLFAFDFDGTLSKIVKDPDRAEMSPITSELIQKINSRSPVAIISGRGLKDLKARLDFEPQYAVGNHGLEGISTSQVSLHESERTCREWKRQIEENLPKSFFNSGAFVEDKKYSLAIHYRNVKNKKEVKKIISALPEKLLPIPRVLAGKSVLNLLPAETPHKGAALISLMAKTKAQAALYVGDDETDEDIFSIQDARIITIRVGYKKTSHAKYFIDRQSQINQILARINDFLDKGNHE